MYLVVNNANNKDNIVFELIMMIHIICTFFIILLFNLTYLHYLNFIFCKRKNRIKNE